MSVEVEQPAATITVVGEARGGSSRAAVDHIGALRTRDGLASRVCVGESVTACCNVCLCCHSNCHLHCIWHLQSCMYLSVWWMMPQHMCVLAWCECCVDYVRERVKICFFFVCERLLFVRESESIFGSIFLVKTNPIRFFGWDWI